MPNHHCSFFTTAARQTAWQEFMLKGRGGGFFLQRTCKTCLFVLSYSFLHIFKLQWSYTPVIYQQDSLELADDLFSFQALPVETDPQKLHDYVCGANLVKENREEIKVKEDHEYPDWLWELRLGELDVQIFYPLP